MYVLSEDEYNRLKLQNQKAQDTVAATATPIEEPPTVSAPRVQSPPYPSIHYTCKTCGKIYKQKRDLRRHVKLVHSITPPTEAIIPKSSSSSSSDKIVASKVVKNKKKKNEASTIFDNVKKWMTMRG